MENDIYSITVKDIKGKNITLSEYNSTVNYLFC